MKHNSKPYCRFAKKIDNFLEEGRELLFSYKPKSNKGLFTRKYNHIKLPHFASHLEANLPESQPPASKHLQENQRMIHLKQSGIPLNSLDYQAVTTQCCINQKQIDPFFLKSELNLLVSRDINLRFREYLLASKQLKNTTLAKHLTAKKYEIASLKDQTDKELSINSRDL